MARRAGEDFIYTEFATGARDAYEDVVYAADATPPIIRGVRSDGGERVVLLPTGEERHVDISVLVASPLRDANGDAVTIQDDMTSRAATLIDSFGRTYKIAGVGHEGVLPIGVKRLLCVRQAGPTTGDDLGAFDEGFDLSFDI